MTIAIKLRAMEGRPELPMPSYATELAAGLDLTSAHRLVIAPGARAAVGTGLELELPPGYEAQVRPRSGLAMKHGVTVLNAPGTIDADYRGEIRVLLINHGADPYEIAVGDRIAQLVIAAVVQARIEVVDSLSTTNRGRGGFGHTGR